MIRLPKQFDPDDLEHSGPHVWPCIAAGDAPARFIHQRPELWYLSARRQALLDTERDGREPEAADRIRCTLVLIETRITSRRTIMRQETLGSFVHSRHLDDTEEDVQEFLIELDRFLRRCLTPEMDPTWSVQLQFSLYSQAKGKRLVTFQRPWM
jgi:hypothetical protein